MLAEPSRRGFLWALSGAGASFLLLGQRERRPSPRRLSQNEQRLAARLKELVNFDDELAGLVELEKAMTPSIPSVRELLSELTANASLGLDTRGEQGLRSYLRARISADFAAGRLLSVGGWLLSRTEHLLGLLMAALERDDVRDRLR